MLVPRPCSGSPSHTSENAPVVLFFIAVGYYFLLLTGLGSIGLFAPVTYGLTFNSMLLHLLRGRFDVDPAAIGYEGYLRHGAVYAYFGILPALVRTPLLLLPDFSNTDLTRLSCLIANSLMALLKTMTAVMVWRAAATSVSRPVLLSLLVATILFSGPQVEFLRPSIYQEVVLWSDVFAAAFVLLVLYGIIREDGFTVGLLTSLAALAGCCLLTRVSMAIGLYTAVGLLSCWQFFTEFRSRQRGQLFSLLSIGFPFVVLAAFAGIMGTVNWERWGNPFVFVDLTRSLLLDRDAPDFRQPMAYGLFSPVRIGFGLIYYFFPIWVFRDGSGNLLLSHFVNRTISTVELPPGSFLLSDPLIVALAVFGFGRLATRADTRPRAPVMLTALALAIPALLMLSAVAMNFRYRMEFYPLFELGAFLGFRRLVASGSQGVPAAVGIAAFTGIAVAPLMWLLYMLSPFGTAAVRLGHQSIVHFYLHQFTGR